MKSVVESYHAHLDVCAQCRDKPFDLCVVGSKLLADTAERIEPQARSTMPPFPDAAFFEAWKSEVKASVSPSAPWFRVLGVWQLGLSYLASSATLATHGQAAWLMSARHALSTRREEDWLELGRMCRCAGMPESSTCLLTPFEATPPADHVHHWLWLEDGSPVSRGALEQYREMLASRPKPVVGATPPSPRVPGRNEPCPCSSGRKYKKCCGGN